MFTPIYFRVINKDLTVYDDPNEASAKVGKLKVGEIYVAYQEKNGWYKLDNDSYCSSSPNHTVRIPVDDVIEMNGKYMVKTDGEVSGMSRQRRVNTNKVTSKIVIFINIIFIIISAYVLLYSWVNADSAPLDTLIQGYIAMMTIVIGLYVWTEKGRELINVKKILKKNDLDTTEVDNKLYEQEQYSDDDGNTIL